MRDRRCKGSRDPSGRLQEKTKKEIEGQSESFGNSNVLQREVHVLLVFGKCQRSACTSATLYATRYPETARRIVKCFVTLKQLRYVVYTQ